MVYKTDSEQQTEQLGGAFAGQAARFRVIALRGPLGAGKTAFTRGLARGLGYTGRVTSPTYAIINEYALPRPLYHFDMYRITAEDQLYELGWEDYLASEALCVVEWSENIEGALPKDTCFVDIAVTGDTGREISIYTNTPEGRHDHFGT